LLTLLTNLLKTGAPSVDLSLSKESAAYGEIVKGHFFIQGGRKSCKIKRLECTLVKEYENGHTETVEEVTTILMSRVINSEEKVELPFSYLITDKLEPTAADFTYRLHTNLVFAENMSRKDHDELVIVDNKE